MAGPNINKIKVVHVSSAINWRGGEQQIAYLILELRKKGVEQIVLCLDGSKLSAFCDAESFRYLTYKKRSSLISNVGVYLKRLCDEESFSVIHTHDSHSLNYTLLGRIRYGLKANIVMSRRVDFPVEGVISKWKYNYNGLKRIICVSECVRQIMAPSINDERRLALVYDGVNVKDQNNDPVVNIREELKIKSRYLIGNIAAIAPHKDYATFVLTANELLAERDDLEFLIVGRDDGELIRIRELIRELDVGKIHILGFREDAKSIIRELDLLLYTSKTEGLGTTILDAMIRRVPVVATNAGGIPEIIENEISGLLSPVGDYKKLAFDVSRLLNSDALRSRMEGAAHDRAKFFSAQRMAEGTLDIYIDVAH